jgi:NAD(P)H-hydrate epimerase
MFMKVVTGAQMRDMDKAVIEKFGLPGIILMENASFQIADQISKRYGPLSGKAIAIICGKGNNGGDGIAVARHLTSRYNAQASIWLVEAMETASAETKTNLTAARNYGIPIKDCSDVGLLASGLKNVEVIIDAILGTGIEGDPRAPSVAAITAINSSGRPVLSIDIPSGLSADSGKAGNPTVEADCTVTLAVPKIGLYLYPGVVLAGEVICVDISFPAEVSRADNVQTIAIDKSDIASWLPERKKGRDSNKGKFGSVAILAGAPGFVGAAGLAGEGAARTGAGLVTLAVSAAIFESMMQRAIDSVMTHSLGSNTGPLREDDVDAALDFVKKRDSIGFGPGIGTNDEIAGFARRFIAECDKPMVIDADALTILSQEPDHGAARVSSRKSSTIMTPHPGEMARLLGIDTQAVQEDRVNAVRNASKKFQAVVILKGQATLVASPDGRLAVNTTGNPGMATGGSGDVLTGVMTTLLAQLDDPWLAACASVFIHGLAGDIAADEIGTAGLVASDIALKIPSAIKACYE